MRSEPLESSADLSIVEIPDADIASPPGSSGSAASEAEAGRAPAGRADAGRGVPAPSAPAPHRSRSRTARFFGEIPLALVICGVGLGLIVIAMHHFRWGSLVISIAVLAAAFFRLVLPTRKAGLLAVRGRFTDVMTTGIVGGALLVLAAVTST